MLKGLKKGWITGLVVMGFYSAAICAWADSDFHPTEDGGNFGIGVELGDPGNWGITGKLWLDQVNALQPEIGRAHV